MKTTFGKNFMFIFHMCVTELEEQRKKNLRYFHVSFSLNEDDINDIYDLQYIVSCDSIVDIS